MKTEDLSTLDRLAHQLITVRRRLRRRRYDAASEAVDVAAGLVELARKERDMALADDMLCAEMDEEV